VHVNPCAAHSRSERCFRCHQGLLQGADVRGRAFSQQSGSLAADPHRRVTRSRSSLGRIPVSCNHTTNGSACKAVMTCGKERPQAQ
jgi:hypothetical protein